MKIEWTAEMIAMVEKRGDQTYEELAQIMSLKFRQRFTKNSLIGKDRRLKSPTVYKFRRRETPKDQIAPFVQRVKKGEPVTLLQLEYGMCKFPIAEQSDRPPYMFCGLPANKEGCSWCDKHRAVVFTKAPIYNAKNARV